MEPHPSPVSLYHSHVARGDTVLPYRTAVPHRTLLPEPGGDSITTAVLIPNRLIECEYECDVERTTSLLPKHHNGRVRGEKGAKGEISSVEKCLNVGVRTGELTCSRWLPNGVLYRKRTEALHTTKSMRRERRKARRGGFYDCIVLALEC